MELQLKENSPEVMRAVYKTIKLDCLYSYHTGDREYSGPQSAVFRPNK